MAEVTHISPANVISVQELRDELTVVSDGERRALILGAAAMQVEEGRYDLPAGLGRIFIQHSRYEEVGELKVPRLAVIGQAQDFGTTISVPTSLESLEQMKLEARTPEKVGASGVSIYTQQTLFSVQGGRFGYLLVSDPEKVANYNQATDFALKALIRCLTGEAVRVDGENRESNRIPPMRHAA